MKQWRIPEDKYEEWGADEDNNIIDEALLQDFLDDGMPKENIAQLEEI